MSTTSIRCTVTRLAETCKPHASFSAAQFNVCHLAQGLNCDDAIPTELRIGGTTIALKNRSHLRPGSALLAGLATPSPRQAMVLSFIDSFIETTGRSPSLREIGRALDIRSTNGVTDHLKALARKGWLDWGSSPRSIRLLADD